MRRHWNESSVATASRTIPIPASQQESEFIDGSTPCLSLKAVESSDSVIIAPSSPCGTPPRKRWEGAFNVFLRGKNQQSPTLSSSRSSSVASMPIAEDLSTGTTGSASNSSAVGLKGQKKKSSFSLIPGSRRLVSRKSNSSYKNNPTSSMSSRFSKGSSGGLFSRGHKSMDALDVPLRKGTEKGMSNPGANWDAASPSRYPLSGREQSSPRSSPVTTQPDLTSFVPTYIDEGSLHGIGFHKEQERQDSKSVSTMSTTPASTTLNDQFLTSAISSNPSYANPYPTNEPIPRTFSGDWHITPIVNQGVEHNFATASAPSLTQLHAPRSHSRTHMYSSNSNSSTPVNPHMPQELDLRNMPEIPSFRAISNDNRVLSSEFHDVGLNLDDSDNLNVDGANQFRQDQLQSHLHLESNNSNRNLPNSIYGSTATIITDCGIPEPPESLDELLGGIGGFVTIHSSSSSHLLSKMDHQIAASPDTKKAFTKIHNSSEYGQDISPFLGGRAASNLDLAGAHKSCIATQQSMLLRSISSNHKISSDARTQFGSVPRGLIEGQHSTQTNHNVPSSFLSQSLPLDTLIDKNRTNNDFRLLKPIQSADSWAQGRRYLIAPAALAACPLSTINSMSGLSTQSAMEAALSVDHPKASGVIELGDACMTYIGDQFHLTCGKWSSCRLVLRQNYLFEYDLSGPLNSLPRGITHLQHAFAKTSQDFQDALELHFYSSPCAKVDFRVLLIRVKKKEDRDHWITCLNNAARLQIEDLWEYKKDQPLGSGRYASIFPARRKMGRTMTGDKEHPCDCALKIIDKREFWRLVVKGRERCDTIVRELAVQSTLTAKCETKPTFLQIHGFFETSEKVVIELELLDGRDLFEYISSKGVLDEEEAGSIIREVLVALDSMSRAGIAHRDIKPANILMTRCDESNNVTSVKLGDFGMSTLVGVDGLIRGRCGSPGYVAPEILKAEAGEGYRNQVDMFSAGVTLYLMLCGYEPFYGESEMELINANKKAHIDFPDSDWRKISPEAKDLVAKMLKTDPKERITACEAVKHPWIIGLEQDSKRHRLHNPESTNATSRNSKLEEGVCDIM